MARPGEDFSNQVAGGGSKEFTSSEDSSIDFTAKNQRNEYSKDNPDASYGEGATGSISTSGRTSSGGGLVAPYIHPFKLEKHTNPDDNSTKVRVYEGNVYAKIDTFELGIITITTGAAHTHSAGSYVIPDHTHNLTGYTAGGSDGAHTHGGVTDSGGAGSGSEGVHQHGISSNMSGGAHQHDLSSLDTAGIVNKSSNDSVTGTSGTNSNSAVDHKFIAITGQAAAPALTDTNFAGTFNKFVQLDDGTNTVFTYHESSHSSGDFYVKWVITINASAVVQNIVGSIERVGIGVGVTDVPFGALTQNGDKELERDDDKLVGTFHQKIGSVSGNNVDQVQFSNINWSMTVLPEVS
tara:strand:- start:897 stop:1949 length:1053 start_codon:yes stop_codon:yes gene_type:complete